MSKITTASLSLAQDALYLYAYGTSGRHQRVNCGCSCFTAHAIDWSRNLSACSRTRRSYSARFWLQNTNTINTSALISVWNRWQGTTLSNLNSPLCWTFVV